MTHSELVARAARWLKNTQKCYIVLTESRTAVCSEEPDALGFKSGYSILVECKASISDMRADKKKEHRQLEELGIGLERWLAVPYPLKDQAIKVIDETRGQRLCDLTKWGLLAVAPKHVVVVRKSGRFLSRNSRGEIGHLCAEIIRVRPTSEFSEFEHGDGI